MFDWDITLMRMAQLLCSSILFGVPLFSLYGPREAAFLTRRIIWVALCGMLLASVSAVVVQTISLTGVPLGALPLSDLTWYLGETRIGIISAFRIAGTLLYAALLFTALPSPSLRLVQTIVGGAILGSFALTGHAAGNVGHSAADFVHVLMAGVWVGALACLCLLLVNAQRNSDYIPATARGLQLFSRVGVGVVALLVASGVANALFAFGTPNMSEVFRSEYGQTLLIKLALLAGMLALAAANRYRLAPRLEESLRNGNSSAAIHLLRLSISTETAIALAVLGLASHLASIEPPT